MTATPVGREIPGGSAFLVERYIPPLAATHLAASVARVARLCALSMEQKPGLATDVQYLHSVYLPTEDTCFCLFRAPSADAVRAVNDDADFPLDRITAAVLLLPESTFQGGEQV